MNRFSWILSAALVLCSVSASVAKPIKAKTGSGAPGVSVALPTAGNMPVTAPLLATDGSGNIGKKSGVSDGAKETTKPALGDAFIAQNILRIYLYRPASISVFNARGQLVFRQDSQRQMEALPLQGMPTGFLYLTLRAGQIELTKKLLYTGK